LINLGDRLSKKEWKKMLFIYTTVEKDLKADLQFFNWLRQNKKIISPLNVDELRKFFNDIGNLQAIQEIIIPYEIGLYAF
jgi:hypothetical protein